MKPWGVVAIVLAAWFVVGLFTAVMFGRIVQEAEDER